MWLICRNESAVRWNDSGVIRIQRDHRNYSTLLRFKFRSQSNSNKISNDILKRKRKKNKS